VPHDDPNTDPDRLRHLFGEPMAPNQRQQLTDLKRDIARMVQSRDADPELALTAFLNLMGSIIGTQFDAADRAKWIAQVQIQLPLYVEVYRSREKRI